MKFDESRVAGAHDPSFCRLCGGQLIERFRSEVLCKYNIQYCECLECGSLQTEMPYWLPEAYCDSLSSLDTGAAQRNIQNSQACYAITKLLGLRDALDFGGGDGLLCRLLRDYGINCYVNDRYAKPSYAQPFTSPDFVRPDLIVAFEVLEHFEYPASDLEALFALHPRALLMSTFIYEGQGKDWWYISPESGQHVFFYSQKALEMVARKYKYKIVLSGGFVFYVKDESWSGFKTNVVRVVLNRRLRFLRRLLMVFVRDIGSGKDRELVRNRFRETRS